MISLSGQRADFAIYLQCFAFLKFYISDELEEATNWRRRRIGGGDELEEATNWRGEDGEEEIIFARSLI
jgi:hypothetical protein